MLANFYQKNIIEKPKLIFALYPKNNRQVNNKTKIKLGLFKTIS